MVIHSDENASRPTQIVKFQNLVSAATKNDDLSPFLAARDDDGF
jgi:hypothetical protein